MVGALNNDSDLSDIDGWKLNVVSDVLAEDYSDLDWKLVARKFDFPEFFIRDNAHLNA